MREVQRSLEIEMNKIKTAHEDPFKKKKKKKKKKQDKTNILSCSLFSFSLSRFLSFSLSLFLSFSLCLFLTHKNKNKKMKIKKKKNKNKTKKKNGLRSQMFVILCWFKHFKNSLA